MQYLYLKIPVPHNQQDILIAELYDLGFDSFEQEYNEIKAYIQKDAYNEALTMEVLKKMNILTPVVQEELPEENWNSVWESNFNPVEVGEELLVRANFHPPNPKFNKEIIITPQMSFGTGHHATSFLMLNTMLTMSFNGLHVLDVGCGTGILAIYAKMENASKVVGVDNDHWAYKNAISNAKLNKVQNIEWIEGTISDVPLFQYDVVIANINKNVIKKELTTYSSYLKNGGELLLSGFFLEDVSEINGIAFNENLTLKRTEHKDDWGLLRYTK